jgi:hypothetical protein
MEHRACVEKLRVEAQAAMFAGKSPEVIDAAGMMEK